jgi:hypothetical protein
MAEATRLLGEYLGATRCAYADLEPDNDRFTIRTTGRWTACPAASASIRSTCSARAPPRTCGVGRTW